jgi:hypothetical protein
MTLWFVEIYAKDCILALPLVLVIINLVGNIAGDVKFISFVVISSVLVVVCDYVYHQLPKKGRKD